MKKSIKSIALIAVAGLMTTTSCDLLKDVDYTVTPDPLEMHGDKVKVKVEVTVPEKSIKKNVYAEIEPKLGNHALKPITIVGENATANGVVIPRKTGGTFTYEEVIDYAPDMEVADLTVTGTLYKKGKEKGEIETMKIADATIVTPLLVNKDFRVIVGKDNFERVTNETQIAQINYLKGSPVVRPTELNRTEIKDLETFLTEAETNDRIKVTGIVIEAYASIEGEEGKNNELSTNRSETAKKAVMQIAGKKKIANEYAQEEGNYSTIGKGEDYKGFKESLEASNVDKADKDRILRILEMYSSSDQREQAIRDLSTYLYLDKNIFPGQRRAEIKVNYELTGYTDEELIDLSKTNIKSLKIEEVLFAATLTDDLGEKMRIYKAAEANYPNDFRPANNVGVIYYLQNDLASAKAQFEKANGIKENAVSKNNLAAIEGVNGNREAAATLLAAASGAGDEVSYNKGILNIQDGNYEDAIANFGGEDTFNKGLAQLLNKNAGKAKSTIDNSDDAETAQGYYLKAIVAAHNDNLGEIVSNLKNAFAKDGSLKAKAMKDREFIKYLENAAFTAIVK
ncbi:MAG TPA: hypothetical protein VL021_09925 [Brumimicrobium sp.]|nr:hypothetical protein [Brumimicrobium sp.]